MRHWFKAPVSIWASNVRRNVTSVEEAARLLLEGWPKRPDGGEFDTLAAREALLAALDGGSIDEARDAFIAAARAAGILAD